jgi:hypothetical protein
MKYRELLEACWTGYQQRGMKKKGNRQVPNCVKMSEQELEEDLKKWFREKWVRFGPDGKIRGECGGRDSSEGKPKCLPASKAHALGKKGRASSAAKKRREDPNPERRGPARNVATKTRSMQEQDIPELQPPPGKEKSNLGRDALNLIRNVSKANPADDLQAELVNQVRGQTDPSSANVQGTSPTGQLLQGIKGLFQKQ